METLENHLIIIGSTLPYSFPTDYIKQTAKILSAKNKVIIFLWGDALSLKESLIKREYSNKFIKKDRKIILFTPIHFIPFRRLESIRQINLLINIILLKIYLEYKNLSHLKKILWIFNYELYNAPKMFGKPYLSLYDCVDFFSSVDAKVNKEIKRKERKLIKNVDFFFVNSSSLKTSFQKYSPTVVPQGFSLDTFKKYSPGNYSSSESRALSRKKSRSPKYNKLVLATARTITKPIIGFVGSINYRLDFRLLIQTAKYNPSWNFVFAGERQKQTIEDHWVNTKHWLKQLFNLKNVYQIKTQPKHKLPPIISQFDVSMIPYNTNIKFNKYCYPMKLFEYFYLGKPVIATNIQSLIPFKPYVKIIKNHKEFSQNIKEILKNGWPKTYVKKQKQLATNNSWHKKVRRISQEIKTLNSVNHNEKK